MTLFCKYDALEVNTDVPSWSYYNALQSFGNIQNKMIEFNGAVRVDKSFQWNEGPEILEVDALIFHCIEITCFGAKWGCETYRCDSAANSANFLK